MRHTTTVLTKTTARWRAMYQGKLARVSLLQNRSYLRDIGLTWCVPESDQNPQA